MNSRPGTAARGSARTTSRHEREQAAALPQRRRPRGLDVGHGAARRRRPAASARRGARRRRSSPRPAARRRGRSLGGGRAAVCGVRGTRSCAAGRLRSGSLARARSCERRSAAAAGQLPWPVAPRASARARRRPSPRTCRSGPARWRVEELPDDRLLAGQQHLARAEHRQVPAVEQADVVRHGARGVDVVGDDQERRLDLRVEVDDQLVEVGRADRVEAGVGLVEQDDLAGRAPARGPGRPACACRRRSRRAACPRRRSGRPSPSSRMTMSRISDSVFLVCSRSGKAMLS